MLRIVSRRARAFGLAAIITPATLLLSGCHDATSIELMISTDLPCEQVKVVTTSITSGALATYETRPPSAVTTRCDGATGHIGSLVLLPSDDDTAEVAVRVVTARSSRLPEACLSHGGPECIVARRVMRFSPHRQLTLPIRMQNVCAGVTCGSGETCSGGRCISAVVTPESFAADDDDAGVGTSSPARDAGVPSPTPSTPTPSTNDNGGGTGPKDAGTKEEKGDKPPKDGKGGADTGAPFSDAGATPAPEEPPPAPVAFVDAGLIVDASPDDDGDDGGKSDHGKPPKPPKSPKSPK